MSKIGSNGFGAENSEISLRGLHRVAEARDTRIGERWEICGIKEI